MGKEGKEIMDKPMEANIKFGVYDEDSNKWVKDTTGLPYSTCLGGFCRKLKFTSEVEMDQLKFLSENHFDIRPVPEGMAVHQPEPEFDDGDLDESAE